MASVRTSMTRKVEGMYRSSREDLPFSEVVNVMAPEGDEDLAELVETDGRVRISMGRPVALNRYVEAMPDLKSRELPLDAAIDVALRALSASSRPTSEAVQLLIRTHPDLSEAITEAAFLAEAVVSTSGVGRIVGTAPVRDLPADFGPLTEDGRRRFQLIRLLGSGSGGEVYLAIDRYLSEPDRPAQVAIKLLAGIHRSGRARQRLAEEATKARRVLHDNVVRVLDRGVSDRDEDYIVYEHVEGGDLDDWFMRRGKRVSASEAATVVSLIARGVQAAHIAGLVHCDLKPSNILVTTTGEPKVADFGIAVRERDLVVENPGKPIGNVAFISPEQYRGEEGSLSPPSDVYALGGILFYLLTATLPNGSSLEEIAHNHQRPKGSATPPSLRGIRPEIDEDLEAICQRAMSPIPSERFASAAALAEDLQSWLNHEPISWRKPAMWKTVRLAAKRKPAAAVALTLAMVAILAGAAATGYWVSVARANRKQAALSASQLTSARQILEKTYKFLKSLKTQNVDEDLLPLILAFEWLYGNEVLGGEAGRTALWKDRISHTQTIVEDAKKSGRGNHIETLFWQGILGFWLLNDGAFDESIDVLDECLQSWENLGLGKDPLPCQLRLIRDAATVQQLALAATQRELSAQERSELETLKSHLDSEALLFTGRARVSPMRMSVLKAIKELYGPRLYNDPKAVRAAQKTLDSIK